MPNHPELAEHMRDFGLNLLAHSLEHACFVSPFNHYWQAFGVIHAAQAAEIIIKSCIANEHPLLIFSKLPSMKNATDGVLTIEKLFNEGKTINYSELPELLWASTGYTIKELKTFKEFGDLRNKIQHMGVPDVDLGESTVNFIFKVIEPLLQYFWEESVFEHLEDFDNLEYIIESLLQHKVPLPNSSVLNNYFEENPLEFKN